MDRGYLVSKKYHEISILAGETARQVSKNGKEWMKYLDTAARLYRYPFEDQMLIYAQRPGATACATMETWNEKMFCWVNRGAKGIALFDRESERPRLKYVFDVADVHKARRIGKDPNLWELREEHKGAVLAQLEKTYGETDKNNSFEGRLMEIAGWIAEDYYEGLMYDMSYAKEGSYLEELDELNMGIRLRETLSASIAYTLLSRCGADMDLWKDELDFEFISEFNTSATPPRICAGRSLWRSGGRLRLMTARRHGRKPQIRQGRGRTGRRPPPLKKILRKRLQMNRNHAIIL